MATEEPTEEKKEEAKEPKEEESSEGAGDAVSKGKSSNKLLLIIIAVVGILVLISINVILIMVFTGKAEEVPQGETEAAATETVEEEGEEATEEGEEDVNSSELGTPYFYQIRPPFVVNIPSKGRIRFLQVQVSVMARDESITEEVEVYTPLIKNALVELFASQKVEAIISTDGKNRLKEEATKIVKRIMEEQTGQEKIERVLFTSFIIQ